MATRISTRGCVNMQNCVNEVGKGGFLAHNQRSLSQIGMQIKQAVLEDKIKVNFGTLECKAIQLFATFVCETRQWGFDVDAWSAMVASFKDNTK